MVRREKGRGYVFRPKNVACKLRARVLVDEWPSIAVAAQSAGRFAVAQVLIAWPAVQKVR
jgi:hypothetical protein